MTSVPCEFTISSNKNVIYITLKGLWTIQKDLEYITRLTEVVELYRSKQWCMCVDMRGWQLPKEVYNSPFSSKIMLNRRTQIAEIWIVDNLQQGDELLPFFSETKIKPVKVFSQNEAMERLESIGLTFQF